MEGTNGKEVKGQDGLARRNKRKFIVCRWIRNEDEAENRAKERGGVPPSNMAVWIR